MADNDKKNPDDNNKMPDVLKSSLDNLQKAEEEFSDDEFQDLSDSIKKMSDPDFMMNINKPVVDAENIDEQLKSLLAEDDRDDGIIGFETDFVEDISIHDPVTDAEKAMAKERRQNSEDSKEEFIDPNEFEADETYLTKNGKKRLVKKEESSLLYRISSSIPDKTKIALTIVLVVLTGVLFVSTVLFSQLNHSGNEIDNDAIMIQIPKQAANNTNYIYVNQLLEFSDIALLLNKITISPTATVFYFERSDISRYSFTVIDKNGGILRNELLPAEYLLMSAQNNTSLSVVCFEPLSTELKNFDLIVKDELTDESFDLKFSLKGNVRSNLIKYPKNKIPILTKYPDIKAYIETAQFSSVYTTIYFSVECESDNKTIRFGSTSANSVEEFVSNDMFTLYESGNLYTPISAGILMNGSGLMAGRLDFNPLNSLSHDLSLTLRDVYRVNKLDLSLSTRDLIPAQGTQSVNKIVKVGDLDLVLEGFIKSGNVFILIYHMEDNSVLGIQSPLADSGNRIEANVSATLILEKSGGGIIEIPGECVTGAAGGDVLFRPAALVKDNNDTNGIALGNTVLATDVRNFTIRIDSVDTKLPNEVITIPLSTYTLNAESTQTAYYKSILNAFNSKLDYIYGRSLLPEVDGFDESLILSDNWKAEYPVQEKIQSYSEIRYFINQGDKVWAIVREHLSSVSEVYHDHAVIYDINAGRNGLIIEDNKIN